MVKQLYDQDNIQLRKQLEYIAKLQYAQANLEFIIEKHT